MASRIYTRTGDAGETGLFGGGRVSKDDVRVTAYGEVDELNAALGVALAVAVADEGLDEPTRQLLGRIQSLLFELGAELATPQGCESCGGVTADDVTALEAAIDHAEESLEPLKTFVLPGGTAAAAALHTARTVCRRAERAVVTLRRVEPETSVTSVVVLNRLSDLLFVLARLANRQAGVPDVAWRPR